MSTSSAYKYETLSVSQPKEYVLNVQLNRPDKLNAMNQLFWSEMTQCFNQITDDKDCRVVIITGAGKIFTAGLDFKDHASIFSTRADEDPGRRANETKKFIAKYQDSFTSIEKCPKPVIAAVHNACIGGGIDMITACDMRYCTSDAYFQVKEVDLGLCADVGTLQRLPHIVGNESLARELCFSARRLMAPEALSSGLVSRVFTDKDAMMEGALEMAMLIASKSPIAVQGTKVNMVYSRDHSVAEALNYVATWNQAMLQSEDVVKAVMASMQKQKPEFSKL